MTINEWISVDWDGTGGIRQLLATVLAGRVDEVRVTTPDGDTILALVRSGLPIEPAVGAIGLAALPLLTASCMPPLEIPFRVARGDVDRFGQQSGDLNPLHFDDAFAQQMGFEGRMVHGMIFSNWLTRYLGTQWPGPGTLFKRSDTLFLAPIYPDRDHVVRLSVPRMDRAKGQYRVVAQVRTLDGGVCTISYSDVVNRHAPDQLAAATR